MSLEYELLDFGSGRKLERLGVFLLDRPAPSAVGVVMRKPELWQAADAMFNDSSQGSQRGHWIFFNPALSLETTWPVHFPPITLELKCSPFGHLGVFPEQQRNWMRIADLLAQAKKRAVSPQVLNLFAYTGGSTLAAATGARVVHIDSAKNLLARARRNAQLSGLDDAPIRWIAEDAVRFVNRERQRRQKYDAIILDPPTYGHGTNGNVWQISRDLPCLVRNCSALLSEKPISLLLTCHTPLFDERKMVDLVSGALADKKGFTLHSFPMEIQAVTGQKLPSGHGVIAVFQEQGRSIASGPPKWKRSGLHPDHKDED